MEARSKAAAEQAAAVNAVTAEKEAIIAALQSSLSSAVGERDTATAEAGQLQAQLREERDAARAASDAAARALADTRSQHGAELRKLASDRAQAEAAAAAAFRSQLEAEREVAAVQQADVERKLAELQTVHAALQVQYENRCVCSCN
jgi:colicin import membrane protein